MRNLIWPVITFLLAAAFLSLGVWWWAYGTALDRLSVRSQTELSLATDRLQSYLQRFRQLSVVLADHPSLIALLEQDSDQFISQAERMLLETADKTGSLEIFVISSQGVAVASSRGVSYRGDFSNTDYFRRAMYGALGTSHATLGAERGFYAAAPIFKSGTPPIGAVVVKVDIETVETDWRANPNILFFTDKNGVIVVGNRFELLSKQKNNMVNSVNLPDKPLTGVLKGFPNTKETLFSGHALWSFPDMSRFPDRSLHLATNAPVIDLRAEILVDAAPARLTALLQAAFALTASLVFGAVLLILTQRRLALSDRLKLEETTNHELEERVALRTEQLSGANLDLRQQINERREAEAALLVAQQDLVQAGKLTALGQISAGISHELNQPLMAIRSFAENTETLLDRGDTELARSNLARISDLARRMGRIIKNLRAFTRKEGEPITNVNLNSVVDLVLELSARRIQSEGIKVNWQPDPDVAMVRGGEVRLQQVLVNLVSNGMDAMEGQSDRQLWIDIQTGPNSVSLSVRDNGPGLDDPEKIFDPFYTTKAVGASEGMGLGLSISYGIVQSFGGKITGRNHRDGGAVFTVELTPVGLEVAA